MFTCYQHNAVLFAQHQHCVVFYYSLNATYQEYAGYEPGTVRSKRSSNGIAEELHKRDIHMIVYMHGGLMASTMHRHPIILYLYLV